MACDIHFSDSVAFASSDSLGLSLALKGRRGLGLSFALDAALF